MISVEDSNKIRLDFFYNEARGGSVHKLKEFLATLTSSERVKACTYLFPKVLGPYPFHDLVKLLLDALPPKDRLAVIRETYADDYNLLHFALNIKGNKLDHKHWRATITILNSLPSAERQSLMLEKNKDGKSYFDLADINKVSHEEDLLAFRISLFANINVFFPQAPNPSVTQNNPISWEDYSFDF